MFFSAQILYAILVVSTSLTASANANPSKDSPGSGEISGAAYFITNEPSGNTIVSVNIGSNGKLSSINAISAGGRGLHGLNIPARPVGLDGLFSQGAIKANAAARILVTVNPGSNTLAMFSINHDSPSKLTMVGSPVSSEGEFPMSVAINSKGTMVCALNGGAVNGVNCYTPDPKLGLIAIPNTLRPLGLNQTTPATGPFGAASHLIFSADDTKVIASVKGFPATGIPGFLAVWNIQSDGSLSPEPVKTTPAAGSLVPFSMTIIPGTNALLVTDAGIGFDVFNFGVSGGTGNSSNSATSTVVPIPGQGATCWSSFSPKSGNFYLSDVATATITEVKVDKNLTGSIVRQYPQAPGSATIDNDIATIGNNNFLYVMAANATTINVLSVNAPGKATAVQNFNFAAAASAAGVIFDKNNLQGMTTYVRA